METDRAMDDLVIWGASGQAAVLAGVARAQGRFRVVGFIDDLNPDRRGETHFDLPILGGREALEQWRAEGRGPLQVALGLGHCAARARIGAWLRENGFPIATVIHPSASVDPSVRLGEGVMILAGVIVSPLVTIGDFTMVNTAATIGHDGRIGSAVHIAPGVHIAGNVTIGDQSWIGIGTVIIEKRTIGRRCFLGAGSIVTRDVPDGRLAFGNPARNLGPSKDDF